MLNRISRPARLLTALGCALGWAYAQSAAPPRHSVQATGEAAIPVQPDQARIHIGVVTEAAAAQDAAARNAAQVEAVLARLRPLLGSTGKLRTLNYSLTPNYRPPKEGTPPTITGYNASNTVEATTSDLTLVGKLIDAASQAGANNVSGLRFSLQDEEPARAKALALAARRARARAEAIASGLGMRAGAVISAQERAVFAYPAQRVAAMEMASRTPVEPGTIDIRASVTVEVELVP